MKSIKIIGIIVGILLFVMIGLVIILPYIFNIDRYRPFITKVLSNEIGREVEISKISLSLLRGISISAEEIKIKDLRRADLPILSVPKVRADIALRSIFSDNVEVKRVVITAPEISIIEYFDGKLNIDGMGGINLTDAEEIPAVVPVALLMSTPLTITAMNPAMATPDETVRSIAGYLMTRDVTVETIKINNGRFFFYKENADLEAEALLISNGINLSADEIFVNNIADILSLNNSDPLLISLWNKIKYIESKLKVDILNGELMKSPFKDVHLDLTTKGGYVNLTEASFSIFEGKITSKGFFDLRGENKFGKITIDVSDIKTNQLLNAISDETDLIVGTLKLTGSYDFPIGTIKEITEGLTGRGKIEIVNGYITDFSLREELASTFKVSPKILPESLDTGDFSYMGGEYYIMAERAYTDNFTINSPIYDAMAQGSLGLDKALDANGEILLKKEITSSDFFKRAVSFMGITETLYTVPFSISGTLDDVEFTIHYNQYLLAAMDIFLEAIGAKEKGEERKTLKELGGDLYDRFR
jgi:AsmA-like protein